MKKRYYKIQRKQIKIKEIFINKDFFKVLFSLLLVLGIILTSAFVYDKDLSVESFLDIKTFITIIAVFVINGLVNLFSRLYLSKIEDSEKLTDNYAKLCSMYSKNNKLLEYTNTKEAAAQISMNKSNCNSCKENNRKYIIPAVVLEKLYGKDVVIEDNENKHYKLPNRLEKNMKEINTIHQFSYKYNNINIRVDDLNTDGNKIVLKLSRTTYFSSLITNRAMDYKLDGVSNRDLYEPGPYLNELKHSVLSNHLGFNGYVETSDNKFVFIYRHNKVSIGKNSMQNSVGSSLKTKYAIGDDYKVSKEGIMSAIKNEIIDELNLKYIDDFDKIKDQIFGNISFEKNVLYFYRDLVEGGKPQLMFYISLNIDSKELVDAYSHGIKSKRKYKDKFGLYASIDGYKLLLVDRNDLDKIYLTPDGMVIQNKFYKAMPSAVATHVMLLDHLKVKKYEDN